VQPPRKEPGELSSRSWKFELELKFPRSRHCNLLDVFGSRGIASEVVSGKRAISKAQAKKLAALFHVPADLFLSSSDKDAAIPPTCLAGIVLEFHLFGSNQSTVSAACNPTTSG
jgi:hypothetical protein